MSSSSEQLSLPLSAKQPEAGDTSASLNFSEASAPELGFISSDEITSILDRGGLLLTANGAQSVDWKRRLLMAGDADVRQTPSVSAWSEWVRDLCEADFEMPVALNRLQEMQLWESVIRQDLSEGSQSASSISGLAKHASQAWSKMCEYGIPLSELDLAGEEAAAMQRWVLAMQERLVAHQGAVAGDSGSGISERALSIDLQAQLPERIRSHATEFHALPDSIILYGFYRFTPLQMEILAAIKTHGVKLLCVKGGALQARHAAEVTACNDADLEMQLVAERVKEIIQQQPSSRIAVVVSESIKDLTSLARCLNSALIPEQHYNPYDQRQAVMMQHGTLIDAPMIEQLMFVLSLAGKHRLSFSEISRLLFSPWLLGFAEEQQERVSLDLWLRQHNRHHVSVAALLASERMHLLPKLAEVLKELSQWKAARKFAVDWVAEVNRLLQACGIIPSGFESQPRENAEINLINDFRDTLATLISIDALGEQISWSRFFSILRSACAQTKLSPEVCYTNVVVMPMAEVAGLHFDHLLLLGFDEQAAPVAAKPLPLLPLPLQQKYGMETATAALAFDYSDYLWHELLQAAPQIEISYAEQRGEQLCRIAAFARGLPWKAFLPATDDDQGDLITGESFPDSPVVPLTPTEKPSGGTSIIRDQSACPFRAFARHRLGIVELGESTPGIEASTKGSLLHLALEYIWRKLGTAEQLHRLDEEAQNQLIIESIVYAWQECRSTVPQSLREVESHRMQVVLQEWLQLERFRPPFQVLALEKAWRLQLPQAGASHFEVYIKADRIDRDADGHRILIDYKSGQKQSIGKWMGERMAEPQLPLYAIAAELGADDAVSFARVRSGEMGFEGLAEASIGINGIRACDGKRGAPESWSDLLQEWRRDINELAVEFVAGRNDVAPRDALACRYCGLEAFCRVDELAIDFAETEDGNE